MVLTGRADPSLPVSRWRGRSWLAELRQRDLALMLPETAELFAALAGGVWLRVRSRVVAAQRRLGAGCRAQDLKTFSSKLYRIKDGLEFRGDKISKDASGS